MARHKNAISRSTPLRPSNNRPRWEQPAPPNIQPIDIDSTPAPQIPVQPLDENDALGRPCAAQGLRSYTKSSGARSAGYPSDQGNESQDPIVCRLGEMTIVSVDVKDQRGWYVFNLSKDDFIVYEDGVPQEITYFTTQVTDPDAPWIGYTIGYYVIDPTHDGRPRKIRVRVRDAKIRGLKSRCQPSVYTLEPDELHDP